MERRYIGLDIGGTKCAAVCGETEKNIRVLKKDLFLTEKGEPREILERFSCFIEEQKEISPIEGIGISCGGPLDSAAGVIKKPPSLPLWDNIEIVKYFKEKFGVPVFLQNDANACAVAEWRYGAGQGAKNMIFLTFGTGFGAGLILNGKLYCGANDNAGEIGHVRLTAGGPVGYNKAGSCEGYCSGSGIARLAEIISRKKRYKTACEEYIRAVGGKENINAKTLAEQARRGNEFCLAVYKKSGEMLGRTLSILVDILNPEKIVIGGVFMRSGDLLLPFCEKTMKKECLSYSLSCVKIEAAGLGEAIGDYAALSVAKGDFQ